MKFFRCIHCGNVATKLYDSGVNLVCCGEEMKELVPNTVDAALEKHVPDLTLNGDTISVKIGSIPHPMTEAHYIVFIAVDNGGVVTIKFLEPGKEAVGEFTVDISKPVTVYEYCNLHGLWSKNL